MSHVTKMCFCEAANITCLYHLKIKLKARVEMDEYTRLWGDNRELSRLPKEYLDTFAYLPVYDLDGYNYDRWTPALSSAGAREHIHASTWAPKEITDIINGLSQFVTTFDLKASVQEILCNYSGRYTLDKEALKLWFDSYSIDKQIAETKKVFDVLKPTQGKYLDTKFEQLVISKTGLKLKYRSKYLEPTQPRLKAIQSELTLKIDDHTQYEYDMLKFVSNLIRAFDKNVDVCDLDDLPNKDETDSYQ